MHHSRGIPLPDAVVQSQCNGMKDLSPADISRSKKKHTKIRRAEGG
jgi:hypothetical protein